MGDLLRAIVDYLQFFWPFKKIKQWERGLKYRGGLFVKEKGPGIVFIIPWVHDLHTESMLKGIVGTPRLDITVRDGKMLTFQASAWARVVDLQLAYQGVDAYMETTAENMAQIIATKLAEVDADRLQPEKRRRLLTDLQMWVNQQSSTYGVEITDLGFTTFVVNPRTYRLLGDDAPVASW